ncbi:uncharacterized protein VICG_01888 [Vittaforma corneae ATCC 50505]|uniref:Uncharacterized protein n=1 Tax=Vittaforma corneae (strain ATCC 50505) TaxID=993615 RepID=L2GKT9_VITCO|nr:uncharacterized protein VICG_01888 [Vittaforma corneae ATCC 50505]ELA41095.1 hypothetical protein VICG_01888 [Vittaforma corneae ATCC 50505]
MQKLETKRKRIPGTRELLTQIKQISEDIGSLETEIKACHDKINAIIAQEKSNSPKAKILSELKEAKDVVEKIRAERKNYQYLIKDAVGKIESLKGATSWVQGGYDSIDKINRKLEDLELKLISTSISAKEESEIAASMASLKTQKSKLSEMENNSKTIEALEVSIKEFKKKLSELGNELGKKLVVIDSLKADLDKLAESSKVKSPEIIKLKNRIASLEAQKSELSKVRNAKREEIHVMEEEYSKFEVELMVQKSLEEQKDGIRKTINALKVEKESLLNEQSAYDPKMYDSLIYSINKVKKSGVFSLDIDLVTHLMKNEIPIPNSIESLDKTIELLNKKKAESQQSFDEKRGKISAFVADIDSKIGAEVEKLNALPATNFEVLRKGGFKPASKSKT